MKTMKLCGERHTAHDWGQDGRCRRCGATWECPPHWWTIQNNVAKCRFCPAERDYNPLTQFFDDGGEFKHVMSFADYKGGERLA
jgi:hypothetical protein